MDSWTYSEERTTPEAWRRRRRKEEAASPSSHPQRPMPPHRDPVDFSVRGPVAVSLDDEQLTSPGCSVIDLIFPSPTQVGELVFRNYYTGWISVLVRSTLSSSQENVDDPRSERIKHSSSWTISMVRKTLMPHPHQEVGSHDVVSIVATESVAPWISLTAMRLVLRQPSPSWRTFLVEEVAVFRDLPRRLPRLAASAPQAPEAVKHGEPSVSGQKENFPYPRGKGDIARNEVQRGDGRATQRYPDGHLAAMYTRAALLWSPTAAKQSSHPPSSSRGAAQAQSKPPVNGGYEIVGLPQI